MSPDDEHKLQKNNFKIVKNVRKDKNSEQMTKRSFFGVLAHHINMKNKTIITDYH